MTEPRYGDWMQTASGNPFFPMDPRPDEIDIEDIAHALSMICRFGGHTSEFYSVADHSVRVSYACDPADAFWGLMHDAAEAYLGDLIRPLKAMAFAEDYRAAERWLLSAVVLRFRLPPGGIPASVLRADEVLLVTEARDLMRSDCLGWAAKLGVAPLPGKILPLSPDVAYQAFMQRFEELA